MARQGNPGVKKSKSKYYHVTDGEWLTVAWRDNRDQCCDCGLIHKVNYRVNKDGQLEVQVFRDGKATGGARRAKKEKD